MEILIRDQLLVSILKHIQTKKTLTGDSHLWSRFPLVAMPNQHSKEKKSLGIRIPRTLYRRIQKDAERRGMTIVEFAEWTLFKETQDVELTSEDYEKIAQELDAAKRGIDGRRIKKQRDPNEIRAHRRAGEN